MVSRLVTMFQFESCVVLDGSQTGALPQPPRSLFESCVVLDGSQTQGGQTLMITSFESCVVLDGSQTTF